MTLKEFLSQNPKVSAVSVNTGHLWNGDAGPVMVHDRNPLLYVLSDYLVSSAVSGPGVLLITRFV